MKEKIDELGFIKVEIFYSKKDTVKRMKRQVRDWEEIFFNTCMLTNWNINILYKEGSNFNRKKTKNSILKISKGSEQTPHQTDIQTTNKYARRYSTYFNVN